jgi:hypothetical protein
MLGHNAMTYDDTLSAILVSPYLLHYVSLSLCVLLNHLFLSTGLFQTWPLFRYLAAIVLTRCSPTYLSILVTFPCLNDLVNATHI